MGQWSFLDPLCTTNVSHHCVPPLCTTTVSHHCVPPLCTTTVYLLTNVLTNVYLLTNLLLTHFVDPMCMLWTTMLLCDQFVFTTGAASSWEAKAAASKGTPLDGLQLSPNGRFIVTGGGDRLIKVWEYGLTGT